MRTKLPRLNAFAIIPFIFLALLYFPSALELFESWQSGEQDNAHAFPAFLAALFIAITSKLKYQHRYSARSILFWSSLFIMLVVGYGLTRLASIDALSYLAIVLSVSTLFTWLFGFKHIVTIGLISLMTLLAIPVWDSLLEPLVVIASHVVNFLLGFTSITVLIEGNSITTPYGRILIAEGCSGIRYFMVSIIFSALVSHLNRYRIGGTFITLFAGVLIGLVANWVRILLLIVIGYYSEMTSSLMQDHEVFGWIVYASVALPAMYFAPIRPNHTTPINSQTRTPWAAFIIISLVAGLNFTAHQWFFKPSSAIDETQLNAPSSWQDARSVRSLTTLPINLGDRAHWFEPETGVFIATLKNDPARSTDKLVPYIPQSLVNSDWNLERAIEVSLKDQPLTLQILKSSLDNRRYIRLQVFNVGERATSTYNTAKLLQIPAIMTGKTSFNYYLLISQCSDITCEVSISQALNLIETVLP